MRPGGYDEGYLACPCFWGREPGSLVAKFLSQANVDHWTVLDAGCGEGKNSHAFAELGARVIAVDCSRFALRNAALAWPTSQIIWRHDDIRAFPLTDLQFDVVVAYGLFHCLNDVSEIEGVVKRLQSATKIGGYHIVCAFNARKQNLTAHPGFTPCLLPHTKYLDLYSGWDIEDATDTDLVETHPHNQILHTHSLTRLISRRVK